MSKEISKEKANSLLNCPFCGEGIMYEIKREDEIGRVIPQLFCNSCKMIFEVENDSPYMSDEKTLEYLKEKLLKTWNNRKPMERIVERLEERLEEQHKLYAIAFNPEDRGGYDAYSDAIEIVKEEGGS